MVAKSSLKCGFGVVRIRRTKKKRDVMLKDTFNKAHKRDREPSLFKNSNIMDNTASI